MTSTISREPMVSVIVPVYNMERYLEQCLEALVGQTLADIEIITVNDGSTDSSLGILNDFASRDERIRVIDKQNEGYGATMNRGLDEARGRYIGIVEPDDYPEKTLYAKLVAIAEKDDCDLVKCNYYQHFEDREQRDAVFEGFPYGTTFDPADYPSIICTVPTIWAAVYRRDFLKCNGIRFRETPGASFQDTSFTLKVWFAAHRCSLVRTPLFHYRMDNPGSSSKTVDKVFTVCDELDDAHAYLRVRAQRHAAFAPWLFVGAWGKYRWNYERIDPSLHETFAQRLYDDYSAARDAGELDFSLFGANSRFQLEYLLAFGPKAFAERFPIGYALDSEEPDRPEHVGDLPDPMPGASRMENAQGQPSLSVIVPLYNCAAYVEECLGSLKGQTYRDFEVLVVDDGSTDGSLDVARACAGDDARFKFLRIDDNVGPGAARNQALDQAQGTYVAFLDGDDYFVPYALEHIAARAFGLKLDDLYISAQSFAETEEAGRILQEDFSKRDSFDNVTTGRDLFCFFEERSQFFTQGALRVAKRAFLDENGIRFPEGIIHEDILFTFYTMVNSKRSSFLNEPLYMRRIREGSIMARRRRGVDNVEGHFVSMQEMKRWLVEHVAELDERFLTGMARQMATWRAICAHDWENDIDPDERKTYVNGLTAADRVDFYSDIVGMGGAVDRVREEFASSGAYRLGSAIVAGPRFAYEHVRSIFGKGSKR